MKNLTPEMIEKAKAARSAEELLALAKENNVEMTEEEAKTYFAQLNPKSGELDDDDLDAVAGGACSNDGDSHICPNCNAVLNNAISSQDTMKFKCPSCNAEFASYAKEGFSVLHAVN